MKKNIAVDLAEVSEKISKSNRFKALVKIINYSISIKHKVPLPQLNDKDYWRNYWDGEEDFWKAWVKNSKSEKEQQDRIEYVNLCLSSNPEENLIAKSEDYYDILGISINEISDKDPFPGEAISIGKIRKAYQKLNLQYHPDKGKVLSEDLRSKILEKIREAGECLGNKYTKQKYDLYLCVKSEGYIELGATEKKFRWFKPNGWNQQKFLRLKRLVDEELIGKFIAFSQEYLDALDLDWKTWNYYQKILGEPTKPNINNLYQETLGKPIIDLFNAVNVSLGNSGAIISKSLRLVRENSGIDELLEEKPTLTKEELDNFPNEEFFNQEWNRVVDAFFESQAKKEKLELSIDNLKLNCKELVKRIGEKRNKKIFLIKELENWLQKGQEILELEEIDKEKIANFLDNFDNYLNRNKDYETEILSKVIQKERQENIENLILELENLRKKEETEDSEFTETTKPINESEKQIIIDYLDEKLYETSKLLNPQAQDRFQETKKVKNWLRGEGLEWDYELEIKKYSQLKEIENIRGKVIEYLYRYRLNSLSFSGNFEELKTKRKKSSGDLLVDFGKKISAEIEVELGIKFNEFLEEEQELITNINEKKKEKYPSIITKNKWVVISKWRNTAIVRTIDTVNDYWKNNQASDRINGKNKTEILGENWEDDLLAKLTPVEELNQVKINTELKSLIDLIDKEKTTELELIRKLSAERIQTFFRRRQAKLKVERLREEWRNNAIAKVNDYWNSKQKNGKIGEKTKEEILLRSWENIIKAKFNETEINFERDRFLGLIDAEITAATAAQIQTLRTNAINAVETHWANNLASLTGKTIEGVLTANWKAGFDSKSGTAAIEAEKNRLTGLIDTAKNTEIITENDLKTIFSINNIGASRVNEWEEFKTNQQINKQTITKIIEDTKATLTTITTYLKDKGVYDKDNPTAEIIDESDENKSWEKFVCDHKPEQVLKTITACKYEKEYKDNDAKKQQLIAEIINYCVNNQVIDKDKYGGDNFSQWTADHFIQYLYEKEGLNNKFSLKDKTITVPTNKEKPFHRLDNWKMWGTYSAILLLTGIAINYWKNKVNSEEEDKDIY